MVSATFWAELVVPRTWFPKLKLVGDTATLWAEIEPRLNRTKHASTTAKRRKQNADFNLYPNSGILCARGAGKGSTTEVEKLPDVFFEHKQSMSPCDYASNQLAALIPLFRPVAVALGSLERLFLFAGFESSGLSRCAIS